MRLGLAVVLGLMGTLPVLANPAFVPQVDRGPGTALPQFTTPPGTQIRQLPPDARPRAPQPPAAAPQPSPRVFLTFAETGGGFPQGEADGAGEEPEVDAAGLVAHEGTPPMVPSVLAGVTVVLTPLDEAALPTVGPGSVGL